MQILVLTNEYPPNVYGGAGVHVHHLTEELLRLKNKKIGLEILCFGDQKESGPNKRLLGMESPPDTPFRSLHYKKLLDPLYRNLIMTGSTEKAELVHCHTWYTYLAGCLIKQIIGIPMIITAHSLEPLRPWKKEQLGDAYYATSWLEKTALENADAVIAVSESMKSDLVSIYQIDPDKVDVIYNGIDTERFKKIEKPEVLHKYGIDPQKPYVLFVGRITVQKGIIHLVEAIARLKKETQVVLCAGAPDTDEIGRQMRQKVDEAKKLFGGNIVWITECVSEKDLVPLYSHASIFVCPSVYEPFGIINLEAMACETPVVASATGGIKEIVKNGETGILVPFEPFENSNGGPKDPEKFSKDLADAINSLLQSPERIQKMAFASRQRVEQIFSWKSIAGQTFEFYRKIIEAHRKKRRLT
ncbi:MAG: glycogen synthase [Desulfobacterales bacterium]